MVSDSTVPRKDGASLGLEPNSMSSPQFGRHVIDKISRHLLWFLFLLFVFSFLDRINIGFAGLTMMKDLGLTGTQFGLATTLFYLAYIACGIPSNIVLARVGARKWIGGIMIAWGLASTATMFATSAEHPVSAAGFGRHHRGRLPAGHAALPDLWFPAPTARAPTPCS